jgi:predicted nucleic acid-binding protein
LPNGRLEVRAAKSPGSIEDFFGSLYQSGTKPLSIEEINEVIAKSWGGGPRLIITADTNVLVRAAVTDDPEQARLALDLLREAEIVALTLPALCELVWVLSRGYRRAAKDIAGAIRTLAASATVRVDHVAVEAGLVMLEAGRWRNRLRKSPTRRHGVRQLRSQGSRTDPGKRWSEASARCDDRLIRACIRSADMCR